MQSLNNVEHQQVGNFNFLIKYLPFVMLFILLVLGLITEAHASSTGSGNMALPYEGWLMTLQKSLTGPVAFSVALIGIVSCGATLILTGGEISRFMRSLIYIVLVMTLLVGANSLMTNFFNGASIGTNVQQEEAKETTVKQNQEAITTGQKNIPNALNKQCNKKLGLLNYSQLLQNHADLLFLEGDFIHLLTPNHPPKILC